MGESITSYSQKSDLVDVVCGGMSAIFPLTLGDPDTATFDSWKKEEPTTPETSEDKYLYLSILLKALKSLSKTETNIYSEKIDALIKEVKELKRNESTLLKINILVTKGLRQPLDVLLEADGEGFIARTVDFDLFGYGDDRKEAIDALKYEIESLYYDLMEDDDFTDEWRGVKAYLQQQIVNF